MENRATLNVLGVVSKEALVMNVMPVDKSSTNFLKYAITNPKIVFKSALTDFFW